MLQPLITLLSPYVSSFTLQVSGTNEMTQVILSPVLAAPAASLGDKGYDENDQRFRALLATPLIIRAPIGEIDTELAQAIHAYSQQFDSVVQTPVVVTLLQQAVNAAERTNKPLKSSSNKPASAKANSRVDDDDEGEADIDTVGTVELSGATQSTQADEKAPYSDDILASLGL